MNKSYLGILLLCLVWQRLTAQPVFQTVMPLSDGATSWSVVHPDGVALLLADGGEARLFLLSPDMSVQASWRVQGLPRPEEMQMLGMTVSDQEVSLYFRSGDGEAWQAMVVRKETGSSSQVVLDPALLRGRSAYWGTVTQGGRLHVLRIPPEGRGLRLCRFEGGQALRTLDMPVRRWDILQRYQQRLVQVVPDEVPSLAAVASPAKLYPGEGYVRITLDAPDSTHILEIDLTLGQIQEYAIAMPQTATAVRYHTFLHGDWLIQAVLGTDSVIVALHHLRTGRSAGTLALGRGSVLAASLYQTDESGETRSLSDIGSWMDLALLAPGWAVSVRSGPDSAGYELLLGGLTPVQVRGATGLVLETQYREVVLSCQMQGGSLQPAGLPLAAGRQPVSVFRTKKPARTVFTWQGRQYVGFYDPVRKVYQVHPVR
ncbi:MAG: hypothetical protein SF053_06480 [Bacteroidia bacterium]|nr:hypothetical protein [Bacteroidia bacterium]